MNLKVLRAKYPDDNDIFIEEIIQPPEQKPIMINQTINVNKPIQNFNVNQTAKVKTTKMNNNNFFT